MLDILVTIWHLMVLIALILLNARIGNHAKQLKLMNEYINRLNKKIDERNMIFTDLIGKGKHEE